MSLTIEDGSGNASATSYDTVAAADAFFSLRGEAGWTGADAVKTAALAKAFDYLNSAARFPWRGTKLTAIQRGAWPRTDVTERGGLALPDGHIPTAVKDAQRLLALIVLTDGDLWQVLDRGGQIASESVGPVSVSYAQGAPVGRWYEGAMELVAGFLRDRMPDDAVPYDVGPSDVGTPYEPGIFTNYGGGGG